ncbi:MAG TPA: heparan-alpha-glucosaminide N-acetyltransferase domain-containing protein [Candidatus Acidoferrum sp.]
MADQIQVANLGGTLAKPGRLAYIDWLRGLACVLMFQAHCYNSWLNADARTSAFYRWSQALATLPAPLFIFLAGISTAMVTQRLRDKGVARDAIARTTILRGAEIYGLGLLFRVQEFVLGFPKSPWTDLLRVDVLNILGLSMMLLGVLCWLTAAVNSSARTILWGLLTAVAVVLATPWVWTTHRLSWLPWPLESYINGVHIYEQPQPWLFPIFPWVAFAFVGLAVGFLLLSDFSRSKEAVTFVTIGGVGIVASLLSLLSDAAPIRLYPAALYDYWHTSPNFFLMRCGVLLALVLVAYAWCRWGWAQRGFSPVIQLGNTSLLVYWVHIEFVYGRFSILPKGKCSIPKATAGLLIICLAMIALSVLRTRWKKRHAKVLRATPEPAAATVGSG